MIVVYIDAQNIHKSLEDIGRIIDWGLFRDYMKKKFGFDKIKIFIGRVERYQKLYDHLHQLGYELVFKETMTLPNGDIKGNVDIDIAIDAVLDLTERGLRKAYLVTGDGDYNTLVDLFRERGVLGRVLIPHRDKASKLLKKSAGADVQVLHDIRFFIEQKNPDIQDAQGGS